MYSNDLFFLIFIKYVITLRYSISMKFVKTVHESYGAWAFNHLWILLKGSHYLLFPPDIEQKRYLYIIWYLITRSIYSPVRFSQNIKPEQVLLSLNLDASLKPNISQVLRHTDYNQLINGKRKKLLNILLKGKNQNKDIEYRYPSQY